MQQRRQQQKQIHQKLNHQHQQQYQLRQNPNPPQLQQHIQQESPQQQSQPLLKRPPSGQDSYKEA